MRYEGRERSRNIDDRRGKNMKRVGGGIGIGTILLVIGAIIFGGDPGQVLSGVQQQQSQTNGQAAPYQGTELEEELEELVAVTLRETEIVWQDIFRTQLGRNYEPATLVLFTRTDRSACGYAKSATGPFYCPADKNIYIDLSFYDELRKKFNASGDFAMAYVVAHEVAHHIQNLLGIIRQVDAQRGRLPEAEMNDLNVRLELQADFLAGVWAHHAHKRSNILERGDIEEAMNAAAAIGDDRIQMRTRGYVVPETFTHGTSEQRMTWLRKGLTTGDINQGDTFSGPI
ncbi:MAG: neutral zinc metallopeptidase [Bacteroidota bacterium]